MGTILDEIVQHKISEVAEARKKVPLERLTEACKTVPPAKDFIGALLKASGVGLIAEVKKASPSKGLIRADFDPVSIAREYESAGANCLSVLTDRKYFQGHLDYLAAIQANVTLPILRKEFIIDPYQVHEARAAGASAVLLIAECLSATQLAELHDLIVELGMTPLVEFHDVKNLEMCLGCNARLIGVNNRNLKTFQTSLDHVIRLRPEIPEDRIVVAESGIATRDDVRRLEDAGIQAMLVGESLMRRSDIGQAVRDLLGT